MPYLVDMRSTSIVHIFDFRPSRIHYFVRIHESMSKLKKTIELQSEHSLIATPNTAVWKQRVNLEQAKAFSRKCHNFGGGQRNCPKKFPQESTGLRCSHDASGLQKILNLAAICEHLEAGLAKGDVLTASYDDCDTSCCWSNDVKQLFWCNIGRKDSYANSRVIGS